MKKSEAIKLIEEVIYDTYDYDPDLGWTVDAEAVLDALLKEGMLPPENEGWMSLDEAKKFYGECFDSNDIYSYPRKNVNRWTSEDVIDEA